MTYHYIDTPPRYHTYNGHTYRIIDRVTSLQFQSDSFPMTNSRRPSSPDAMFHVKPTFRKKQISFSPLPPKHNSIEIKDSDEEEEEEEDGITQSATIHVAVRRDASLFKIEKASPKDCQQDTPIDVSDINNDTITQSAVESSQQDKNDPKDAGLLTPPDSPQTQSQFDREISSDSYLDLSLHPQIIHVHKVNRINV